MINARLRFAPIAVLSTLSLLIGCSNTIEVHELTEGHQAAFVAQDEALDRHFSEDAGWQLGPVMAGSAQFNRAGLRFDASGPVDMQLRVSKDGGETFGDWSPLVITYQEDIAHNAHLDVDAETTHAQIRFRAPVESRVSFLAVELFDFEPIADEEGAALEDPSSAEQGLAADGVAVSRAAWGARASRCTSGHTPNRITVHHTVTPNNDALSMPARMRQIQNYHMSTRGWCDVGYHFLVGQDGRVYEGRPERKIGAHAGGDNTNNAGVSFIGDFSSMAPSQAQMSAAAQILRSLADTYGISLNRTKVKGHREVGTTSTSCPGNQLYNRLSALIAEAAGSPAPATPPPSSSSPAPSNPPPSSAGNFCAPTKTGSYCDGDDLVVCQSGTQISRERCDAGCQGMPQGTPDQCFAPAPPSNPGSSGSYADVSTTHEAFTAIESLSRAGVLAGCGEDRFCPDVAITRAELAVALSRLDGLPFTPPATATFHDVANNHWAYAGVEETAARGFITGCTSNDFCPSAPVSRAFTAVILQRAKSASWLQVSSPRFDDVPLNHWASGAVERVAREGWVAGCSATSYCPNAQLTRGQAAIILANAYGY